MATGREISPGRGRGRGREISPERGISPGKGISPGRSNSLVSTRTEWPATREEFMKWFWSGKNGNKLIKELNCSTFRREGYIRREKERPTIYGIVLNDGYFPGREGNVQWKLCKVGFTHVSTVKGTLNRMEQVQAEIKRKYETEKGPNGRGSCVVCVANRSSGCHNVFRYREKNKKCCWKAYTSICGEEIGSAMLHGIGFNDPAIYRRDQ